MKKFKILFGVCGIGRGHTYRQLPIIKHFENTAELVIFAFGESLDLYSRVFENNPSIKIIEVNIPWICGSHSGIDFETTSKRNENEKNFLSLNFKAMQMAQDFLGKPDLVISDYEPISAQYAYATGSKIITIDQQSKYFIKNEWPNIGELSYQEEVSRLGLFFPHADARIVTSFFNIDTKNGFYNDKSVIIFPPVLRENILSIQRQVEYINNEILVYISPYSDFVQAAEDTIRIFESFQKHTFSVFASESSDFLRINTQKDSNVKIYKHGDNQFLESTRNCIATINTAGHTFISEMLYLRKPMYTVPLNTFEQNYNAKMIHDHGFGLSAKDISFKDLKYFLGKISHFSENISQDNVVLKRGVGQNEIIDYITKHFLSSPNYK